VNNEQVRIVAHFFKTWGHDCKRRKASNQSQYRALGLGMFDGFSKSKISMASVVETFHMVCVLASLIDWIPSNLLKALIF